MHPGVGFPIERFVPPEGAVICGTHLPGGTNVSMSAPTIHYDRSIFGPDAHGFRPERWLEATTEQLKTMDRAFFAFGYGARTCIGKNISIVSYLFFFLEFHFLGERLVQFLLLEHATRSPGPNN